MSHDRRSLPQLDGGLFLTDAGIETTLIYLEGLELPHFAAFDLLRNARGRQALRRYYERHIEIAKSAGVGFVLESPTWRSSPDWGEKLGYSKAALDSVNEEAIALMHELRAAHEAPSTPMVVSGCVGPRGDGYRPEAIMTPDQAEAYHGGQVGAFARAGADLVTAITMTNTNEAIGVARAARAQGMPVVISFTLETDGRLPTGQPLSAAIEAVDAATGAAPAYYMINCAHPDHFDRTLAEGGSWIERVRGIRANASRKSHAELDQSTELDSGSPAELGSQYRELLLRHPHINVLGGCCGTDHRHIEHICAACRPVAA
jgi:S-methylmethionine-dependent homocysteine/selenocysteine methylase